MYDSFDVNEGGSNEFDNTWFIVWYIHILGLDGLGKAIVGYFVSFDESPIKAIDWSSAVDEGFGDDVFIKSVFEDR